MAIGGLKLQVKTGEGGAPNGARRAHECALDGCAALTYSEAHKFRDVHSTMQVLRTGEEEVIRTLAISENLATWGTTARRLGKAWPFRPGLRVGRGASEGKGEEACMP